MKNISAEIDEIVKDENADWVIGAEKSVKLMSEDGTEACSGSIITVGGKSVRIGDLVEFLQLIGVLNDEPWR